MQSHSPPGPFHIVSGHSDDMLPQTQTTQVIVGTQTVRHYYSPSQPHHQIIRAVSTPVSHYPVANSRQFPGNHA